MFNYSLLAHPSVASKNFPPLPTPLFSPSLPHEASAIIYSSAAKPTFGLPKHFPNTLQATFAKFCESLNTRCFKTLLTLSLLCNLHGPGCTEEQQTQHCALVLFWLLQEAIFGRKPSPGIVTSGPGQRNMLRKLLWNWTKKSHREGSGFLAGRGTWAQPCHTHLNCNQQVKSYKLSTAVLIVLFWWHSQASRAYQLKSLPTLVPSPPADSSPLHLFSWSAASFKNKPVPLMLSPSSLSHQGLCLYLAAVTSGLGNLKQLFSLSLNWSEHTPTLPWLQHPCVAMGDWAATTSHGVLYNVTASNSVEFCRLQSPRQPDIFLLPPGKIPKGPPSIGSGCSHPTWTGTLPGIHGHHLHREELREEFLHNIWYKSLLF